MYKSVCSECGEKCEVAFKPTVDKPVLCSRCSETRAPADRAPERSPVPSTFPERRMHLAICADCGSECQVPFRPTPGKPIYCKKCFRKGDSTGGRTAEQFKEQFEKVNAKLDSIIRLLNSMASTDESRERQATGTAGVSQAPKVTIIKKATKTAQSKKAVKKKTPVKKTVTKKATRKSTAGKMKTAVTKKIKTASPKKSIKKTGAARKTVTKKATRKKKG